MNKRPVNYKQYDPRWSNLPYNGPGENGNTIGAAGCGPTSAAMLISTLLGKDYFPSDACSWAMLHDYKEASHGTKFAYFAAQFKAVGLECFQLSWTNVYHNPDHKVHDQALDYLNKGYYLIGLAQKGLWTGGGHFIVIYDFDEKYVYVNDSNHSGEPYEKAPIEKMRNEIAYYWVVDARAYNRPVEDESEDEDMSETKFYEMFEKAMLKYRGERQDNDVEYGQKSKAARDFVVENKIMNGDAVVDPNFMWEDFLTREQAAILIHNLAVQFGLTTK